MSLERQRRQDRGQTDSANHLRAVTAPVRSYLTPADRRARAITDDHKLLGGLDRSMSASQQRQDLIARVFAETVIKRLYRRVYRAIRRAAPGRCRTGLAAAAQSPAAIPASGPTPWTDRSTSWASATASRRWAPRADRRGAGELVVLHGARADGPFVTAEGEGRYCRHAVQGAALGGDSANQRK